MGSRSQFVKSTDAIFCVTQRPIEISKKIVPTRMPARTIPDELGSPCRSRQPVIARPDLSSTRRQSYIPSRRAAYPSPAALRKPVHLLMEPVVIDRSIVGMKMMHGAVAMADRGTLACQDRTNVTPERGARVRRYRLCRFVFQAAPFHGTL